MREDTVYDLCIVGAGMIGSAAARHATLAPGRRICLVGPEEPKSRQSSAPFGAYYDEGRIARALDPDRIWGKLSLDSMARYRQLEEDTGIRFYEASDALLMADASHSSVEKCVDVARHHHIPLKRLSGAEIRQRFAGIAVPDCVTGLMGGGGVLNPRRLVCAEQTAAHLQGCDIFRDVVTRVTENQSSQRQKARMKVVTEKGFAIYADKVLLAPGAFTGFQQLLPQGVEADTKLTSQTVVFAEVSKQDAEKMKSLPCISYRGNHYNSSNLNSDPDKDGFYFMPPILYPNGKLYMKIGHFGHLEKVLTREDEVMAWYANPPPVGYTAELTAWLSKLFPGVRFRSLLSDTCVTTETPSRLPYVDLLHPGLGVAIGGNGRSAKSCDEIGRMAADLVMKGFWEHELPADFFKFQRRDRHNSTATNSKL